MSKPRTSLSVSVRRYFVDTFFFSRTEFLRDKLVIDIGGKKKNKRGLFDIDKYAKVMYVNLDESTEPDVVADAAKIPLPDESYDAVILGEILEHVPDPVAVLKEARRLLRREGRVLATVPFNVGIHGDPHDYGRYTETYWKMLAEETSFRVESIERQGTMFAVLALMLQHLFRAKRRSWEPLQSWLVHFLMWLDGKTKAPLLKDWTTGYGIVLTK